MLPTEFEIEGRTVIVTGAARGIGKGTAAVLAEAGAQVMVTALTDHYLGLFADQMAAAGHPILTLKADATSSRDWERTVDYALERWGHIDALVNNLGDSITRHLVPLPGHGGGIPISDEEYRSVLDVNLTEAFLGCRAVGAHMLERGAGKVINISSASARKASPEAVVYGIGKAGLLHMTMTLALEWASYGITVNCIAPGGFPDPEHGDPDEVAQRRQDARTGVPLGRVGDPREVGFLVLYLISGASNYMTGETIFLDGGVSIK